MEKEIVILGCGLSGMITALTCAKSNIKTTIIEYNSVDQKEFCSDIRTTALTPSSGEFLKHINLWPDLEKIASEMLDVYVADNRAPEILHLFTEENNKILGYIVKNSEFKKILLRHVRNNTFITLIDNCEYEKIDSYPDKSVLHLKNDKQLNCDLLIICDGPHSKARKYYFSDKISKSYSQIALTFNIKHDKPHENCALEHFLPQGPFAILPLKDPHSSSVVWSSSKDQTPLLMNLPREELEYLIQKNAGRSLGVINIEGEIKAFPLKARITNKYYYNRLVLVADSAHIVHPLAGQGLNQGIKDIEALIDLISHNEVSKNVLEQYQKLRENDNYLMYMITDGLNRCFSNHGEYLHHLRQAGFKILANLKPIKNLLTYYAMGKR